MHTQARTARAPPGRGAASCCCCAAAAPRYAAKAATALAAEAEAFAADIVRELSSAVDRLLDALDALPTPRLGQDFRVLRVRFADGQPDTWFTLSPDGFVHVRRAAVAAISSGEWEYGRGSEGGPLANMTDFWIEERPRAQWRRRAARRGNFFPHRVTNRNMFINAS